MWPCWITAPGTEAAREEGAEARGLCSVGQETRVDGPVWVYGLPWSRAGQARPPASRMAVAGTGFPGTRLLTADFEHVTEALSAWACPPVTFSWVRGQNGTLRALGGAVPSARAGPGAGDGSQEVVTGIKQDGHRAPCRTCRHLGVCWASGTSLAYLGHAKVKGSAAVPGAGSRFGPWRSSDFGGCPCSGRA